MGSQHLSAFTLLGLTLVLFAGCQQGTSSSDESVNESVSVAKDLELVQHGKMREVIGKQQHHGRIGLQQAVKNSHLFAVGALEGLTGEFTICDGKIVATEAPSSTTLKPVPSTENAQAALLVGFHIDQWQEQKIPIDLSTMAEFEEYVSSQAQLQGIDTSKPFPFVVEGELVDLRLHVIRGACPVHSKRNGVELGEETKPFQAHHPSIEATLVGVYAKEAAGDLTHPGTSTHTHAIFADADSVQLNGHVESTGVVKGSTLRLPKR